MAQGPARPEWDAQRILYRLIAFPQRVLLIVGLDKETGRGEGPPYRLWPDCSYW